LTVSSSRGTLGLMFCAQLFAMRTRLDLNRLAVHKGVPISAEEDGRP
jgi:hypothetical protein